MFALIQWTKEKKMPMGETEVLRVRFCTVPLKQGGPAFLMRRRCSRAARQLVRLGITRAVFPADFAWVGEFAAEGVLPADPLPLYRAMAAELVQAAVVKRMKMERPAPALRLAAVQQGMAKTVAGASVLVVATSHCTRTDIHQRCYRRALRDSEA